MSTPEHKAENVTAEDHYHMKNAIALARQGLGRCAPNPSVGCVIVKDNHVIARARTADQGRPHAETQALKKAGKAAQGATLYVTLEPCTHQGQTPPCSEAIISAGIHRVVIGSTDRNPKVAGTSEKILQKAGIYVASSVLEQECDAINAGFFLTQTQNRPFVTLKTACSLDGKIALKNGHSQWITGESARKHAHLVRSQHDAILIGIETARSDNPSLTTRLDGISHNSIRVILDSNMRIDPNAKLVKTAYKTPLWLVYKKESDTKKKLEQKGVKLIKADTRNLTAILAKLAHNEITRLLVEGGAQIHTSFLQSGLWDELLIYRAPRILGDDAAGMIGTLNIENLNENHGLRLKSRRLLGEDTLETFIPAQREL